MPVEIKELHIRVAVNAASGRPPAQPGPTGPGGTGAHDQDALVAEAVEQVLEILAARKDR